MVGLTRVSCRHTFCVTSGPLDTLRGRRADPTARLTGTLIAVSGEAAVRRRPAVRSSLATSSTGDTTLTFLAAVAAPAWWSCRSSPVFAARAAPAPLRAARGRRSRDDCVRAGRQRKGLAAALLGRGRGLGGAHDRRLALRKSLSRSAVRRGRSSQATRRRAGRIPGTGRAPSASSLRCPSAAVRFHAKPVGRRVRMTSRSPADAG